MRLLAATACIIVGLSAAGATASPARAPTLRLVAIAPVKLRGTNFLGLERVRVALTRSGRTFVRRTRASRAGSFTVSFGFVALEPCSGAVVVRATGARGSRSTYRRRCASQTP